MEGVLNDIGWIAPVIVNERTGHVVDGHMRVSIAISKGEPRVPVAYVDLDEAAERLALATFNPISALAATDKEQQRALLEDVRSDQTAVAALLSQLRAEAQDEARVGMGDARGEYEISAELHERQDYLVFYVDNEFDWNVLCQRFGVETVYSAPVGKRTLKPKGVGRVLPASKLLAALGLPEGGTEGVADDAAG
jgi:hypothetical protein